MDGLRPPDALRLDGNIAENWKRWRQKFELYMMATDIESKADKVQSSTLLHVIGDEALEIYNTFVFEDDEDKTKLKTLLEKFDAHFTPQKSVTFERHVFNMRVQGPGENIDQFVTDLKIKAKSCEYGDLCDSLIKDRIVVGIRDDQVRAKLLRTKDLDLTKAVSICRAAEASRTQMDQLQTAQAECTINEVKKERPDRSKTVRMDNKVQDCKYCGREHQKGKCPAYGEKCRKCGKMNHFSTKCMSKTKSTKKPVRMVEEQSDSETEFYVDMVKANNDEDWEVNLKISGRKVRFKIDTGAQCNVIPESIHRDICDKLERSKAKLVTYAGHCLRPKGKCTLLSEYKGKYYDIKFQVVDKKVQPVLGLKSSVHLGLIKRVGEVKKTKDQGIQEKYADVFEGLGCIEGEQHIKIKEDAQPVVHAPRKVPVALREKVKEELRRMEKLDVIEKVTEPRAWVSSMVTIWKPEKQKIRICMDPKDLNDAIQREHYPMKTIEEVMTRMPGAKVFSTLDAQCGYWQVKLDKKSSELCTFNTPFGRYAYKRLPFGINTAGEIFQRLMSEMFEDLEGVEVIVDDILVWGKDEEQHDQRLKRVLDRVREKHIRLNAQKCTFKAQKVNYMGHILTADGLNPDPKKVEAVIKMKKPTDKTGLQQYLGMVTYLGKFLPQLSTVTAPLRILLEKTTEWSWMEEQDKSFESLQKMVTEAPVLKCYDAARPVTLSVDASSCGVGAVLFQDGSPIAYASKAFTDTQKRYAQIEKELAAIVYGCDKFYQYLFGRPFEVETDHKPLETIMKKPLAETPLRLQKMLLKLQKYNMTVRYKKGKELYVADALSRNYMKKTDESENDDVQICAVKCLPIAPAKLDEMCTETAKDQILTVLKRVILQGWPNEKSATPAEARPYWDYRSELTVEDELILKGNRVVIPNTLRKNMLKKLHASHQGIEKTKRLARDIMFWPGMSAQITDMVSKCSICNTYKKRNCKEPMIGHDIPDRPWQKIATDLFELDGEQYLVLVDYYSSFFEVNKLTSTKSQSVINICKQHFSRLGIPDELCSDNASQYSSAEFKQFSVDYGFKHTTSSPTYPQSNGKAEKAVHIAKTLLKKAKADKTDPYLALLDYRNTPLDGLPSPAQLLMGRRTKTRLPTVDKLLMPEKMEGMRDRLKANQDKNKHYYDKGSHTLPTLKPGDTVRVREGKQWRPAKVIRTTPEPRSYVVEADGHQYRRNRRELIRTHEEPPANTEEPIKEIPVQATAGTAASAEGPTQATASTAAPTGEPVGEIPTAAGAKEKRRYPVRVRKPKVKMDL